MRTKDVRIVDCDAHFYDSVEGIAHYFDEPLKSEIFDRENPDSALHGLLPDGSGDRNAGGRIQRDMLDHTDEHADGDMSKELIPEIMEMLDLDDIVLLSNQMLRFPMMNADDGRMVQVGRAFTDFMLDNVADADMGIYTMVAAPWSEPEKAADLINRVGGEEEVVGVCMEAAGAEPPFGHHRYDPIYKATQENDLPLVFHAGGSSLDDFYIKGYESFLETHTLGFLWANQSQMTSIVTGGVPEKFPDLTIAFQESGLSWIPALMHRLDAEYMKRQSEAPLLTKRPSEYMKEFYYGTQPLDMPAEKSDLESIIDMIGGPERIMYASDYPHWDYDEPSVIDDLPFLSTKEKKMIFSKNAEKVFGI